MGKRLPSGTLTGLEISDLFFNSINEYQDYSDVKRQAYEFLNNLPSLKATITAEQLAQNFFDRL